jgi:hypothetical protein
MLRLIHTQTTSGVILINDIDDGTPNKTAKQGLGDPSQYHRDGSVLGGIDKSVEPGINYPKQKCYVPYYKQTSATTHDTAVKGYIDLAEDDRVLMSLYKGVIKGMIDGGKVTAVTFAPTDLATPVLTMSGLSAVSLTLTGTGMDSLTPNVSSVVITGTGAVTLTKTQIVAGGGSFSDTSVVIPVALMGGVVDPGSSVKVLADDQYSNTLVVTEAPVITDTVLNTTLTITGDGFLSVSPAVSSVVITGTGAVTLTRTQILVGGTFTDTSIVIPAGLIPGVVVTASSVKVAADGKDSNVVVVTATPTVTDADLTATELTITGTGFTSIPAPTATSVIITGTGAVTLTYAAIIAAPGGSVGNTSIVIPVSLITGVVEETSLVQVLANLKTSTPAKVVTAVPVLTTAVLSTDLTITGTKLESILPAISSVIITGTGAVTLTKTQILAAGGTAAFSDLSIVIPAALIVGVVVTSSSAQVQADGNLSAVVVITAP